MYPTLPNAIKNSISSAGPCGGVNQLKKPLRPKNKSAIPKMILIVISNFFMIIKFFPLRTHKISQQ